MVLIYGPDAGLVHERAEALVRVSVDDPADMFSLIRIDGDELSANPYRLVEEANTIPMFGGRRAIWVRAGSRNIVPAVEAVIAAPSAGLPRRHRGGRSAQDRAVAQHSARSRKERSRDRLLCRRRARHREVIDDELKKAGLAIAPDARAALMPFLGGDRQASRGELQKLALYVHGNDRIPLEDVMAVVADASAVALDNVIDAAFSGKPPERRNSFRESARRGHRARRHRFGGASPSVEACTACGLRSKKVSRSTGAVEGARPPIHFRRKSAIETALRAWTAAKLLDAMTSLADALFQTRLQSHLAETIAQRSLMTLAAAARKKG